MSRARPSPSCNKCWPRTFTAVGKILYQYAPESADVSGDRVNSVTIRHLKTQDQIALHAPFFVDATELGDLLPLAGIEYVTGAESKSQTGEPHAVDGDPLPQDMQGFTYCFAVDYLEGRTTRSKPALYDFWREYKPDFWPDKLLSLTAVKPSTNEPVEYEIFPGHGKFPLYQYRQILDPKHFAEGTFSSVSLVNWPQNDYWLGSIIDVPKEDAAHHIYQAKQLSLSLLYWLQTEVPRPDGGKGYPGLRLRPDVVGTEDGMAMYPYIRESRRIQAEFTVLEQHVATESRPDGASETFPDSVGIGCYRIDLHPSTGERPYIDISSCRSKSRWAAIPKRMKNVLAASKTSVTHITNGCYRLHPVEWNIGEAAGYCVSYCLDHDILPTESERRRKTRQLPAKLVSEGIELAWPALRPV